MKESKYFKPAEFACKCCGEVHIEDKLIDLLDAIREEVGHPVYVTSGYRCQKHNTKVGGAKKSQHMEGIAADIYVRGMSQPKLYHLIEEKFNPGGLGLYSRWVHVDARKGNKARWNG